MTAMTTAMTEAYFRAPPVSDKIHYLDENEVVLACPISASPWQWNHGLGMLTHKHTGHGAQWVGPGKPASKANAPYYDPRTINAEVSVEHTRRDWLDSEIEIHAPTTIDTKPVPARSRSSTST